MTTPSPSPSPSPTSTSIQMSPTLFASFVLTPPQQQPTPTTPSTSSLPPSLKLSFTITHCLPVDSPLISEFLYLDKRFSPDKGGIVRECFHVSNDSLDKFKRSLFHQSGFKFTTFEALSVYIWRSKIKALGVKDNEKLKLGYSINIRRLVKPSLPTGYWGNACVLMYVQLSAQELIERPIWEIAELIRKSESNVTDEYVQSFIDYQELHFAEGITAGKWVTRFMDWRHLGHSTMDYGWGGPVTVLRIGRNNNDPCYFLPYSTASAVGKKEGFKVLVTLAEATLPAFRKDMQLFAGSQEQ